MPKEKLNQDMRKPRGLGPERQGKHQSSEYRPYPFGSTETTAPEGKRRKKPY